MNSKKLSFAAATLVAAIAGSAHAAVAINVDIFGLHNAAGAAPSMPSKTMLIVDRDGDGLAGFSLDTAPADTFLFDTDDWIVEDLPGGAGRNSAWQEATGNAGYNQWLTSFPYSFNLEAQGGAAGVTPGDKVFLFWFPELAIGATAPGANQQFGVLEIGVLPQNGFGLNYANVQPNNFPAAYVTVPEPASAALIALGCAAMFVRRRTA